MIPQRINSPDQPQPSGLISSCFISTYLPPLHPSIRSSASGGVRVKNQQEITCYFLDVVEGTARLVSRSLFPSPSDRDRTVTGGKIGFARGLDKQLHLFAFRATSAFSRLLMVVKTPQSSFFPLRFPVPGSKRKSSLFRLGSSLQWAGLDKPKRGTPLTV